MSWQLASGVRPRSGHGRPRVGLGPVAVSRAPARGGTAHSADWVPADGA